MDKTLEAAIVALAVLGFIGWLGGGRKWAFRTLVSAVVLAAVGVVGVALYGYWTDKVAEHRAQNLHECAVAKVANPKCDEAPKNSAFPHGAFICPIYTLSDNASPQQEEEALAAAEQECRGELDPKEKPLHEELAQYKREHGLSEPSQVAKTTLTTKECAAKVRSFYPHAYTDIDDENLTKKVLVKYPEYCDIASSPTTFQTSP
jgi:hypothetical protein